MKATKAKKATQAQEAKWADLPRIHPNAAGLDIHANEIVACVPCDRTEQPIRVFGTYTPDLEKLAEWLQACGIETVAMEATGVYWVPVHEVLEARGFEVYLVNARHVKNVPGRKSDVSDAQWSQTLHTYGLLRSSFLSEGAWRTLRAIWRHRASLIEHRAAHIQHMQKALQQMNIQLTQVLSDITGVTGMEIIRAIVAGQRDPVRLAQYRNPRCASSEEEIAKALMGHYRAEHVFTLKQALALYDFYTVQIRECDAEMERQSTAMEPPASDEGHGGLPPLEARPKKGSHCKNAPAFDVRTHLYHLTGVDLTAVHGIEENIAQTIISETGTDMSAWPTAKHYCSWLGLACHNDISGGKVLRSKTLRTGNRAGQAYRLAAQSVMRSDNAFGAFFRRKAALLGKPQATVATAHKIARVVYTMLKHQVPFHSMSAEEYERQQLERDVARLKKRAAKLGFELTPTCTTASF